MQRLFCLSMISVLTACGISSKEAYEVTGIVQAVNIEDQQIKIAHEEIPGFMPAMTMSFDVESPDLLEDVEPGMKVQFDLTRDGTMLTIESLRVLDSDSPDVGSSGTSASSLKFEFGAAPDFTLTSHMNEPLSLRDLRGSIVLLDFIFTRCAGPCPIVTTAHAELQAAMSREVAARTRFVSVSLDPTFDTPAVLRRYAKTHGANLENWYFLTGPEEEVAAMLKRYRVGSIRQPNGNIDHTVITFLIDPEGNIDKHYMGLKHSNEKILADVTALL